MTNRVLRWLSALSLALVALEAAWLFGNAPVLLDARAYILSFVLLPYTAVAVSEVTGVAVLVVSLQRQQWGWFTGALLCLVFRFYAGVAVAFPASFRILHALAGGPLTMSSVLYLYEVVVSLSPIVLLALVYAWTRRQSATTSAAG